MPTCPIEVTNKEYDGWQSLMNQKRSSQLNANSFVSYIMLRHIKTELKSDKNIYTIQRRHYYFSRFHYVSASNFRRTRFNKLEMAPTYPYYRNLVHTIIILLAFFA